MSAPRRVRAALLAGLANAAVAVAVLYAVRRLTAPSPWFAYAPLQEGAADVYGFPWEYVALPLALVVLNAVLLPRLLRG